MSEQKAKALVARTVSAFMLDKGRKPFLAYAKYAGTVGVLMVIHLDQVLEPAVLNWSGKEIEVEDPFQRICDLGIFDHEVISGSDLLTKEEWDIILNTMEYLLAAYSSTDVADATQCAGDPCAQESQKPKL